MQINLEKTCKNHTFEEEKCCVNIALHRPKIFHSASSSSSAYLTLQHTLVCVKHYFLAPLSLYNTHFASDCNVSNKTRYRLSSKKFSDGFTILSQFSACFLNVCRVQSSSSSLYTDTQSPLCTHTQSKSTSEYSLVPQPRLYTPAHTSLKEELQTLEQTSSSFCPLTQLNFIDPLSQYNKEPLNKPLDCQQRSPTVEVEYPPCSPQIKTGDSWQEVLSNEWSYRGLGDDFKTRSTNRREARSILKRDSPNKSLSPSRITFAMGRNLVSVFEYPSYESLLEENNENNHFKDKKNTEFAPYVKRKLRCELSSVSKSNFHQFSTMFLEETIKNCKYLRRARKILRRLQRL